MREGKPVTVDVVNDTDVPELVHWHGFFIPPEVDGVGGRRHADGSRSWPPPLSVCAAALRARAGITPTRWRASTCTEALTPGNSASSIVEPAENPGRYDQEVFLALREWEPFLTSEDMDEMEMGPLGPQPEKPAVPDKRQNGLEVGYRIFSINDKSLGAGEPIRVRQGQRLLVHVLNASATGNRSIAFAGHLFNVVALDGNPVASPHPVEVLALGPGERVDAVVEMNRPGIWILGATKDDDRNDGMGILVEYANQHGDPQWVGPHEHPMGLLHLRPAGAPVPRPTKRWTWSLK